MLEKLPEKSDALLGCLLGTAVGDALGLPFEGLTKARGKRILGAPDRFKLCFGFGMISDDTEHAAMTAHALIVAAGDVEVFSTALAGQLRAWLLAVPAGVGFATLRACLKLLLGYKPMHSGVFSAGNGPAMRAAILGAYIDDLAELTKFVRACTRITHTDPKAEHGAFAVALAAYMARKNQLVSPKDFADALSAQAIDSELLSLVRAAAKSATGAQSTQDFATSLGLGDGVSGYVYHTVPVALHAWFCHPRDFRAAVVTMIECGGDTDSTAAIVGGIVGASVGSAGIPDQWRRGVRDWPRSMAWLAHLARQLANAANPERPLAVNYFAALARNLLFILVILTHVVRRALPPY